MTTPTFDSVIAEAIASALEQTFKAAPGIVQTYDAATATATIQPATRRPIADDEGVITYEAMPPIQNVPVTLFGGASLTVHAPLAAGDVVLLVWADYSFAAWRSSGVVSDANDNHAHGPSYPVAIPWYRPRGNPDADASAGKPGGLRLHFGASSIDAGAGASFVATATKVQAQLDSLASAINGWVPVPNDGGAALKAALTAWVAAPKDVASTNLKAD